MEGLHGDPHRFRNRYRRYKRKRAQQRAVGVALIAMSLLMLKLMANTGEDCSAILLTVPFGFYLLFSKKIWIM